MFFLLGLFYFLKSISYGSDSDSIILAVEVADHDFASSLIGIVLLFCLAVLVPLHCVGLSATGLTVGEDGCVVPVDHLLNESRHLQTLEDVLLIMAAIEYFVETVVFPRVIVLLINAKLVSLSVNG